MLKFNQRGIVHIVPLFLVLVGLLIAVILFIVPNIKEYNRARQVKEEAIILKSHLQGASDKLQQLEKLRKTSPFKAQAQDSQNNKKSQAIELVSVAYAQSVYDTSKLEPFIEQAEQTSELSNELLAEIKAIRESTVKLQEQVNNPNKYLDENLYLETVNQIKESEDSINATYEIASFYSEYGKASALFATGIAKVEIQLQQKQDVEEVLVVARQQLDAADEILASINKNEAFPEEMKAVSLETQKSYAQLSKALSNLTLLSKKSSDTQVAYLQEEVVSQLAIDYDEWKKIEAEVLDQEVIDRFDAKAKELSQKVEQANQNQPSNLQVVVKVFTKEEGVAVFPKPTARPVNQLSPTPTPLEVNDLGISVSNIKTKFVMKAGQSQSAFTVTSNGSSGISMYGYPTSYGPGINWNISSAGLAVGRSVEIKVQVNNNIPPGTYKGNAVILSYPSQKRYTIPNIEVTVQKEVVSSTPNNTPAANPTSVSSTSNPTATSIQTPASIGLQVNASSVDLTIEDGKSAKAFDLTSTGATGFTLYGNPTDVSGINWSVSTGGMTPGSSTPVNIQVNSGVNPGTYSGTAVIKNQNGVQISLPVKVTVVRTQASSYVKVISPNGGETLKVGDKASIRWEGNNIDKCTVSYSFGAGSLNYINTDVPTTGNGSYEWTVNIGNTTNTQVKIDLLCYKTGIGQVSDQSDNFFTVTP